MIIQKKFDKITISLVCLLSLCVLLVAHRAASANRWYYFKKDAASIMEKAEMILAERAEELGQISAAEELDGEGEAEPLDRITRVLSNLQKSPIETTRGLLSAKRSAMDPNFSAVIIEFFRKAGVQEGDNVAVAFSGSLPGANIAVLSAAKAMGLNAIIISSLGGSPGGATSLDFTWLDMEKYLFDKKMFPWRSVAASMGGKRDIQLKKSDDERILIKGIVRRNGIPLIYEENLNDSVKKRMEIYREQAGEKPIKAFVNVGGGVAALGKYKYRKYYPTGAFFDIPVENFPKKGVMRLMIESGVPVINVRNINYYVKEYGVVTPEGERQSLGKGKLFLGWKFHVLVAAGALAGIIIIFALAVLFDGYILPGLRSRFSRRRD